MTTPSKCLFCRRHFSAYIDGEIAPHLRADMDSHLATCPACRKELQDLETMLGTLTVGKAPDPSRDLDRAIMRRITLHIPSNGMPSFRSIPIYAAVMVFLVADQNKMATLSSSLRQVLGKKAAIASPETFLRKLGSMFALSDRFSMATSLIVLGVVFLLLLKTVAGAIQERAREIAVLKCLGWTSGNLRRQIAAETLAQCLLAATIGVILAGLVCWILSFQTLDILIPWEMSPTPHFLPGGSDPVYRTVQLPIGLSLSVAAAGFALAVGMGALISLVCAGRIINIKPSEVLRHE